jgi:hypothetical protein
MKRDLFWIFKRTLSITASSATPQIQMCQRMPGVANWLLVGLHKQTGQKKNVEQTHKSG